MAFFRMSYGVVSRSCESDLEKNWLDRPRNVGGVHSTTSTGVKPAAQAAKAPWSQKPRFIVELLLLPFQGIIGFTVQ